jgi:hypothetical protein
VVIGIQANTGHKDVWPNVARVDSLINEIRIERVSFAKSDDTLTHFSLPATSNQAARQTSQSIIPVEKESRNLESLSTRRTVARLAVPIGCVTVVG